MKIIEQNMSAFTCFYLLAFTYLSLTRENTCGCLARLMLFPDESLNVGWALGAPCHPALEWENWQAKANS